MPNFFRRLINRLRGRVLIREGFCFFPYRIYREGEYYQLCAGEDDEPIARASDQQQLEEHLPVVMGRYIRRNLPASVTCRDR